MAVSASALFCNIVERFSRVSLPATAGVQTSALSLDAQNWQIGRFSL